MGRFLLHAFLFSLLVLVGVTVYVWPKRDYIPVPNITTNTSLNAKLHMLKERRHKRVDLLAIGSSMTLNNLSSRAVLEHYHDTSYLNIGSWGTDILQSLGLAQDIVPIVKPLTVLMVTNLGDFSGNTTRYKVDSVRIERYLTTWSEVGAYIRTRDAGYYLRDMELNEIRMNDPGNYERLVFDAHGGVQLDVPKDRIDPDRFNKKPPAGSELSQVQYDAFDRFCAFMKARDIRLVVIQAPYRVGIRTAEVDELVARHVARLRAVAEGYGHRFLDGTGRDWADDLFCDYGHFNAEGAYQFTRYAFEQR